MHTLRQSQMVFRLQLASSSTTRLTSPHRANGRYFYSISISLKKLFLQHKHVFFFKWIFRFAVKQTQGISNDILPTARFHPTSFPAGTWNFDTSKINDQKKSTSLHRTVFWIHLFQELHLKLIWRSIIRY